MTTCSAFHSQWKQVFADIQWNPLDEIENKGRRLILGPWIVNCIEIARIRMFFNQNAVFSSKEKHLLQSSVLHVIMKSNRGILKSNDLHKCDCNSSMLCLADDTRFSETYYKCPILGSCILIFYIIGEIPIKLHQNLSKIQRKVFENTK